MTLGVDTRNVLGGVGDEFGVSGGYIFVITAAVNGLFGELTTLEGQELFG